MAAITLGFYTAALMFWDIFWALVLGFALSGAILAFVPRRQVSQRLGKPGPRQIGLAVVLGAISSSCSYSAAAMSRQLFRKGAHIIPALAFLLASTNLVVELTTVLWVMMGWQFVAAEFVGGIALVAIMSLLMRAVGPLGAFERLRTKQAGAQPTADHCAPPGPDDESAAEPDGESAADPRTLAGWRSAARAFESEWRMIGKDIALGVVVSGFLMALVPAGWWATLFLRSATQATGQPSLLQIVENAAVGPLVSVFSFVCSVGNIPFAAVLYRSGISFGGAISFIYADLIIIPLILVYRRYFGWRLAIWITGVFYASMVSTGIVIELLFGRLGWIPERQAASTPMPGMGVFAFDSTFWLNLAFAAVAVALIALARSGPSEPQKESSCCHHDG